MNHRDYVILQKISSELNIAKVMLGDVYSTVVNDFPALLSQISDILSKEEDERT